MRTTNVGNIRLYRIWVAMRTRCYNVNFPRYRDYGGRGITICHDWDSYESFMEWSMSHGYADNLSIDRIDNDGNYEPSNCRWTTTKEQNRNSRSCTVIHYHGESHCIKEWCELLNLPYGSVRSRFRYGWSAARTFETPFRTHKPYKRKEDTL